MEKEFLDVFRNLELNGELKALGRGCGNKGIREPEKRPYSGLYPKPAVDS